MGDVEAERGLVLLGKGDIWVESLGKVNICTQNSMGKECGREKKKQGSKHMKRHRNLM